MTRWRKWLALAPAERRLLLEVVTLLVLSRVALWLLPFRWIAPYLGQPQAVAEVTGVPRHARLARQTTRAIGVASRCLPWESSCLVQAMTARMVLGRRGCPSTLYLGVARDARGALQAHAWVYSAERCVSGGQGAECFTVIATFA